MKFICGACCRIFTRDMRKLSEKSCLSKKGYKGYCLEGGKITFSKPVQKKIK